MKQILFILTLGGAGLFAFGQKSIGYNPGIPLEQCAIEFGDNNWYLFKENTSFAGMHLFEELSLESRLSKEDSMMLLSSVSDELGYRHFRYQQAHKGVLVEDAVWCVHEKKGRVISANGRVVQGLTTDNTPVLSTREIIEIARTRTGSLNNTIREDDIALVYARKCDTVGFVADNYFLAYRFSEDDSIRYYDAQTGVLTKKYTANVCFDNCHEGIANTLYNGWQNITTAIDNDGNYCLIDSCRGNGIVAKYNTTLYSTPDNYWDFDTKNKKATVSAFWAAEMAYDYFLYTFNINSFDDSASTIKLYLSYYNPNGASWNLTSKEIHCGVEYGNSNPFVSLDDIGHEYTHGIVQHTSNLGNIGEAGALNESFADIFGTMVEFYAEGDNADYLMGGDITSAVTILRSLSNPKLYLNPDTYHGTYWYSGNDDGEFIHRNCGVQNYWFYLLAEGGEGVNDNNYHYQVQGIGREKAAMIAYRNMVHYMNSSCDYSDARNGAILSAVDLFGANSPELLSTIAAWDAVGVNNAGDLNYDCETNCSDLETEHNIQGIPVTVGVIHDIVSTCCYVPNQVPVQYYAGGTITLKDGFCSGDNFTAFAFPTTLPSSNPESMSYLSGPRTSNGTDDTSHNISQKRRSMPSVNIYPNPTNDFITVVSDIAMLRVTLFDITGRKINHMQYQGDGIVSLDIDVSSLPSGIYMVQAVLADNSAVTKRIIKN